MDHQRPGTAKKFMRFFQDSGINHWDFFWIMEKHTMVVQDTGGFLGSCCVD
jgi:hypothetical protein